MVELKMVPVNTPDADFRIQSAWRILAGMVLVEVGRDRKQAPVELPLVTDTVPSQVDHTKVLEG